MFSDLRLSNFLAHFSALLSYFISVDFSSEMLLNFPSTVKSPSIKLLYISPVTTTRRQIPLSRINSSTLISKFHGKRHIFNNSEFMNSPKSFKKSSSVKPLTIVKSSLSSPIISPNDSWGTWTALFASAAFGFWFVFVLFS